MKSYREKRYIGDENISIYLSAESLQTDYQTLRLKGVSASIHKCFGRPSRIYKFVPFAFMRLSQALGQKLSGSVGKLGAAFCEISTAFFTKSGALLMNSLENSIKSDHFLSAKDRIIFTFQPIFLNFNPLRLG